MESLLQDVRYAFRMLRKSPLFATVAVLTIAIGIGANTAIFSLTHALLLRDLPVGHPQQLIVFGRTGSCCMIGGIARNYNIFSHPQYRYFRDQNERLFSGVTAFSAETKLVRIRRRSSDAVAETARGKLVAGNYFTVLEVHSVLGRTFSSEDDRPDAAPVVVISYPYWSKEFDRDPAAVGSTVEINGTMFTIVGVTAPGFFGETFEADPAEMWFPISTMTAVAMFPPSLLEQPAARWLDVVARLRPGVTLEQASTALTTELRQFLTADPEIANFATDWRAAVAQATIQAYPGRRGLPPVRGYYSEMLGILRIVVALVLGIACANLASILLARATARQREISIRLAVGASRLRLLRQLLTESLLLGVLGGAAGLAFAIWGSQALLGMLFRGAQVVVANASPDVPMIAFLIGVSLVASVLFGIAPAVRASRLDMNAALKTGPATAGRSGNVALGRMLVAVQVALSLMLIVGAGLFVRTLVKLARQDFGFDREHVLMLRIETELAGYKPQQLESLYQRIRQRLNALPGVRNSAVALYTPLRGENWSGSVAIAQYSPEQNRNIGAAWNRVGAGYFDTMGIPVLLGRAIGPQDVQGAPDVAVVNQTFAREFFPGQNPVGQRFGWSEGSKSAMEIVGVVQDTRHTDARSETPSMFFMPMTQRSGGDDKGAESHGDQYAQDLVVRALGDPATIANAVRQALREIDPGLPVTNITTAKQRVSGSVGGEELMAGITSFFGGVAVLLAALGLYGLISYAVARRTNEIGVRMALGASTGRVLWMVLRQTLLLVAAGGAAGIPLTLAATRLVRSQLFGVEPYDPLTVALAVLLLVVVAVIAGYLPARRAAQIDPIAALRQG